MNERADSIILGSTRFSDLRGVQKTFVRSLALLKTVKSNSGVGRVFGRLLAPLHQTDLLEQLIKLEAVSPLRD